ncbi:MAG: hypothetical protein CMJ50_02535 [Planctomycetaceae bacterium]|nr:hypothetical protein [Planctomycetaceae bacterium]
MKGGATFLKKMIGPVEHDPEMFRRARNSAGQEQEIANIEAFRGSVFFVRNPAGCPICSSRLL